MYRRRRKWRQKREAATHVRLDAAREVFPEVIAPLESYISAYRGELDRMVFDSSYEVALVVQILPLKPHYQRVRPLAWGLDAHPIADPKTGRAVDFKFPALAWTVEDTHFVLITQVPFKAKKSYVVDFAVGVWRDGKVQWVVGEVDGPKHLAAQDDIRTARLRLPVVRFRYEDIVTGGIKQFHERIIAAAFPTPKKAAA